MKSPHLKADPALTLDRAAHATDANQTWSDARGETTEPGPPPRLDPSTGLGRDDDGRTQPDLIGPGGKLVGFGGLRPDVRVQAESAGRSAARYDAKAAPARSVLPMEEDTSRRIVVNQTQPMGLPIVPNQPAPDSFTVPIASPVAPATPATELVIADPLHEALTRAGDDAPPTGTLTLEDRSRPSAAQVKLPPDPRLASLVGNASLENTYVPADDTVADGNETVSRARQPWARGTWLAASVGVGIAITIALSIALAFADHPSATMMPAGAPKSSFPAPNLPSSISSAASVADLVPSVLPAGSAALRTTTSIPPAPAAPNGPTETGASSAVRAPRPPKANASAVPSAATRSSAVATSSAVVPIEPKQAPSSGDILRSQ